MSGPAIAFNGKRVTTTSLIIPYYGAWSADVVLAQTDTVPVQSTLQIGNLSLVGSVYRMASFSGARSVRLVGGYGGWRKTVPPQGYQNSNGIKLSLVLGDAAAIVGEQVKVATDTSIGTSYVRESAPAERILRQLAGATWWVDTAGVTQIGTRATSAITSSFQVIKWSGATGVFEVATETVEDWMPARTFTSTTVTTMQTIGMTSIAVDNEGKLRVRVMNAGANSS